MSDHIVIVWFMGISVWCIIGLGILKGYEDNSVKYSSYHNSLFAYLNPVWLYENYNINFFGAFLLMLQRNLYYNFHIAKLDLSKQKENCDKSYI